MREDHLMFGSTHQRRANSKGSQKQVLDFYQQIQRSRARLLGPDGRTQVLPASLSEFLASLIAGLGKGHSVTIVHDDAQLTTVEAGRMLGVSRQFLIKLLERDEIPYHMVGTHRRLYVRDVLAYKARRDRNRQRTLDELTRAEADDGLYDLQPPDDRAE
jgi:excisionase family DNA binding protein